MQREQENKKVLKIGLAVAVLMVGFGFALVPLYDIICDITGLNGKTGVIAAEDINEAAADHTVIVQFDGTVNSDLPWSFKPQQFSMEVVPGKLYHTEYIAIPKTPKPHIIESWILLFVVPGSLVYNVVDVLIFVGDFLDLVVVKYPHFAFEVISVLLFFFNRALHELFLGVQDHLVQLNVFL